jgi:hypothetical protein
MTPLPYRRRCLMAFAIAALAASLPGLAQANDRDLRATTIPAQACQVTNVNGSGGTDRFDAFGLLVELYNPTPGLLYEVTLLCPLPLNAIDLGGTSNDNDISNFSVHHMDGDGRGENVDISIDLMELRTVSGAVEGRTRCFWRSSVNGPGSTAAAIGNMPCAVDLLGVGFYVFQVVVKGLSRNDDSREAWFTGIRFP